MMFENVKRCVIVLVLVNFAIAIDVRYTEIATVTDDSRYMVLHPDVECHVFEKTHYIGGQYVFTSGKRISGDTSKNELLSDEDMLNERYELKIQSGDRLILNFEDSTQFTKSEDVEALLRYPAQGADSNIITQVEIYAAVSSENSDTFFVDGGVNQAYCDILLAYNKTNYVDFEIFIYGY